MQRAKESFNLYQLTSPSVASSSSSSSCSFPSVLIPNTTLLPSNHDAENNPESRSPSSPTSNSSSITSSTSTLPCSNPPPKKHNLNRDQIIQALSLLSADQQRHIRSTLQGGQEFPYPLSCPKRTIWDPQTMETLNFTVIVAYHIGMLNNWKEIAKDHLTLIESCGLGSILSQMHITYSNNNTHADTFQDLNDIVQKYSFASKVQFEYSYGMPLEGAAINWIQEYCTLQHRQNNTNKKSSHETVAFYFHSKGSSRYTADWNTPEKMKKTWTYSRVLYWRKYMDYFLLERPEICIRKIVQEGAQACGVYQLPLRQFFGGNFWATACSYAQTIPPLYIGSATNKTLYWNGEGWITANKTSYDRKRFVNLSSPPAGLYSYLIDPRVYSDYAYRWKL